MRPDLVATFLPTQEVEIVKIMVPGQLGQKVNKNSSEGIKVYVLAHHMVSAEGINRKILVQDGLG
jgi:hypothetical protein